MSSDDEVNNVDIHHSSVQDTLAENGENSRTDKNARDSKIRSPKKNSSKILVTQSIMGNSNSTSRPFVGAPDLTIKVGGTPLTFTVITPTEALVGGSYNNRCNRGSQGKTTKSFITSARQYLTSASSNKNILKHTSSDKMTFSDGNKKMFPLAGRLSFFSQKLGEDNPGSKHPKHCPLATKTFCQSQTRFNEEGTFTVSKQLN